MIIDMRDPMPREHLQIAHTKQARVADFNRVPIITGELQEELIEPFAKFIRGHAVPLELEQERAGM
jgi:hypothetical protein